MLQVIKPQSSSAGEEDLAASEYHAPEMKASKMMTFYRTENKFGTKK